MDGSKPVKSFANDILPMAWAGACTGASLFRSFGEKVTWLAALIFGVMIGILEAKRR